MGESLYEVDKKTIRAMIGFRIGSIILVFYMVLYYPYFDHLPLVSLSLIGFASLLFCIIILRYRDFNGVLLMTIRFEILIILYLYFMEQSIGNPLIWFLINPILNELVFFYKKGKGLIFFVIIALGWLVTAYIQNISLLHEWYHLQMSLLFFLVLMLIEIMAYYKDKDMKHMVTNEKNRIANEIHDGIIQVISGANYLLDGMLKQWDDNPAEEYKRTLEFLNSELRSSNNDLKDIIYDLSDNKKVDNWFESIKSVCSDFAFNYNVECNVYGTEGSATISLNVYKSIVRIIKEALSNSIVHGIASEITVYIVGTTNEIMFKITDNGVGFDDSRLMNTGLGLNNIQTIIKRYNGEFDIKKIDQGVELTCSLQIGKGARYEKQK